MNLNIPLLRPIRILLFPFSVVFGFIIVFRNFLYNKRILSSTRFNFPVICVGNLAVGGTGKSPMVEFLVKSLKDVFTVAILSRGYKRKTRGYAMANETTTVLEIGDEPMQFHTKFPDVTVAVGEERLVAIPQLLHDRPGLDLIILDDAFQHRSVSAGLNILLTEYSNLYSRDWYLPTGDLRDAPRSYKRADVIVVTKCPPQVSDAEKDQLTEELRVLPSQKIFFSSIRYELPYHLVTGSVMVPSDEIEVLLVTGIANPRSLKRYVSETFRTYYQLSFADHHIYSIDDLREIIRRFKNIPASQKIILTTEKDAVRLAKFNHDIADLPIYVIPIEPVFLFGDDHSFIHIITNFIKKFKAENQ
ncbi:MAG TPA: tetraacyldisaccharide 4'-kinase [Puia sp.]|nr:tetraacyldisaccharide 4'-kinase [Puia sp.]